MNKVERLKDRKKYLYESNQNLRAKKIIPKLIDQLKNPKPERTREQYYQEHKEEILAKVYVFKVGISSSANEVYQTLKLKSSQGLNIKLNETNEFGAASFFMNDPTRSDTAFLTVRISGLVYAFSYPKAYHSQVKNLIQLIEWELG